MKLILLLSFIHGMIHEHYIQSILLILLIITTKVYSEIKE